MVGIDTVEVDPVVYGQSDVPADRGRNRRDWSLAGICARIVESRIFDFAIVVVIVANAVVLGIETYPSLASAGLLVRNLERLFLTVFVVEIAIRILAHGRRPQDFFRHGWNVFDFVVIAAAFIPGLHGDSAVLRIIRVARVLRLVRFSPGLRTIVGALTERLDPHYDEDGDGVPDEADRIALTQRLDDMRAIIAELERELHGRPARRHTTGSDPP